MRDLRVRLGIACLAVLATGIVTAAVRIHQEVHYNPLETAGFFGPTRPTDRFVGSTDGDIQQMHPTGGQVTSWDFALLDSGRAPVTIDNVIPVGVSGRTQWSIYRVATNGYISGVPATYHEFPARLSSRFPIRLKVSVAQANCTPKSQQVNFNGVDVYWHALGFHHETYIADEEDVQYCPSAKSKRK
jgi:hypothetical protein